MAHINLCVVLHVAEGYVSQASRGRQSIFSRNICPAWRKELRSFRTSKLGHYDRFFTNRHSLATWIHNLTSFKAHSPPRVVPNRFRALHRTVTSTTVYLQRRRLSLTVTFMWANWLNHRPDCRIIPLRTTVKLSYPPRRARDRLQYLKTR